MTTPITSQRRTLAFHDLDDAVSDAETLLESGYARAGKWSLAQCCEHLSEWLRFPVEGFPRQPAPIRAIFWVARHAVGKRMLAGWLSNGSMPAGKPTMPETVFADAGDDREAVERFRERVTRFKSHSGPYHPSPLFGQLDHETATRLQLVHCAHHLSFLIPTQS
ncbi:MAG: DUF1569 domain-containing protein [Planctomycetota bacterium]|nr:DUF1569 domain-containing protein [Planctomycetaceae bacterium]MDQ3330997.1 DUF1569 domain-containing protein [Planctomycetota bacterium]